MLYIIVTFQKNRMPASDCFSFHTKVYVLKDGVEISMLIDSLKEGDLVKTLQENKIRWTKITKNIKREGQFEFIQIDFQNLSNEQTKNVKIQVTPSHGMLVLVDNSLVLKTAKNIVVGDQMFSSNGEALIVAARNTIFLQNNYQPLTDEGSLLANDVLVSTFCEQDGVEGEIWEKKITDWKMTSFASVSGPSTIVG